MYILDLILSVLISWSPFAGNSVRCSMILADHVEACESSNPFLVEYERRLPQIKKRHKEYMDTMESLAAEIRHNLQVFSEEGYPEAYIYQYYSEMSAKAGKLEGDMYIKKEIFPLKDLFAWAIPNEAAIKTLAKYGPIVEIGAGKGYWAYLLSKQNVDIVAFDNKLEKQSWFPVLYGDEKSVLDYQDRTLLLCWPPPGKNYPLASRTLSLFKGKYVIYVGEGKEGGATGDAEFFKQLEREFKLIETAQIPQYPGYSDKLFVYQRN